MNKLNLCTSAALPALQYKLYKFLYRASTVNYTIKYTCKCNVTVLSLNYIGTSTTATTVQALQLQQVTLAGNSWRRLSWNTLTFKLYWVKLKAITTARERIHAVCWQLIWLYGSACFPLQFHRSVNRLASKLLSNLSNDVHRFCYWHCQVLSLSEATGETPPMKCTVGYHIGRINSFIMGTDLSLYTGHKR